MKAAAASTNDDMALSRQPSSPEPDNDKPKLSRAARAEQAGEYDLSRRISWGMGYNNDIIGVTSIADALDVMRGEKGRDSIKDARQRQKQIAQRFEEMLRRASAKGNILLPEDEACLLPYGQSYLSTKNRTDTLNMLSRVLRDFKLMQPGAWDDESRLPALWAELDKIAWRNAKLLTLPGWTFTGTFSVRNGPGLIQSSGLMAGDLDHVKDVIGLADRLAKDPLFFIVAISPSGTGIKLVVRIPDEAAYDKATLEACWDAMAAHIKTNYPEAVLNLDKQAKAVSQLMFFLHDAEAWCRKGALVLQPLESERSRPKIRPDSRKGEHRHLEERQPAEWAVVKSATDALMGHLESVPNGPGERNGFWTRLGYAYRSWFQTLEDESVEAEARDYLLQLAAEYYGGGTQPVQNALDSSDGSVTLGTLFKFARDYAGWLPPGQAERVERAQSDGDSSSSAIRGKIVGILLDRALTASEKKAIAGKAVVRALSERGKLYYHQERRDFDSALYFDGERKQLLRIRSDAFGAWLSDWLAINRSDVVYNWILAAVETAALAGELTTPILPEGFFAARAGALYVSNGDGKAVKIMAGKVEQVDNGTDGVLFAAGCTLAPWTPTDPQDPFAVCSLFGAANCAAQHGLDLLGAWIYSLPSNPACKPPLCLVGDVGSGKTRLAKGIAELYGLPVAIHKAEENGERDFWPCLDGGGLLTLDNCDTRNAWLADAVAAAATGGCSQRRKLYTDAERVMLRARAWLALTTCNPSFASDAGLADRLLVVRMNRRSDETSDARLSDEIAEHRDGCLSEICRALAEALADQHPTPVGLNVRHPDFATLAVKIGRAVGRERETIAALRAAETDKSRLCLENDALAPAVLAYLYRVQSFTGTARELLAELVDQDASLIGKVSPKRLGKRLTALLPHFVKVLGTATAAQNRESVTVFNLATAGFAGFESALAENPLREK